MENNNMRGDMIDFDLNLEPLDAPHDSMLGLGSLLTEIETAHGRIEERIRQLEAVNSRARQRHRWRQGRMLPQTTIISTEPMQVNPIVGRVQNGEYGVSGPERTVESSKGYKRSSAYLVAKALEVDTDVKREETDGGSFFDCYICLDMARDPILTCCGHLFCWPCFYQLPCAYNWDARECPVCKGEVIETQIIPIYGHGNNPRKAAAKDSGLKVPPRPRANRIESMRQQRVARGISSFSIEEAMRLIGSRIARQQARARTNSESNILPSQNFTPQGRPSSSGSNVLSGHNSTSQAAPSSEAEASQSLHNLQVSRLLSQGTASFSFLSSALNTALNSAERLVEDLEEYINSHLNHTRSHAPPAVGESEALTTIAAVLQLGSQALTTGPNTTPPPSSSRNDASATVIHPEGQVTDIAAESNLPVLRSSSSFSSLSSAFSTAMNSAERSLVDLEEYIHSHLNLTRGHAPPAAGESGALTTIAAVLQLGTQALTSGPNTTLLPSSSSSRNDASATVIRSEDQATDSAAEINFPVPHSSSSRRRNGPPGAADMESGETRETRRRRLR